MILSEGVLPNNDINLSKWRSEFDKALRDMAAGKLTSIMFVTALVEGDEVSGDVHIHGSDISLSSGVDLAIQTMVDNEIEPWCDYFDDDDIVDFDEIDFGETAH